VKSSKYIYILIIAFFVNNVINALSFADDVYELWRLFFLHFTRI